MRATHTGLSIVLAVAIGASFTWLWTSRGAEPAASGTHERISFAPQAPAFPEVPGSPRSEPDRLTVALPVASMTPPSVVATASAADDSTYDRMLAFAQADPGSASTVRDLIEKRERFLFTPDDPDWGRRTEQALRDFLQAKTAGGGPQITSVSCRSAGCEVQALSQPLCPPPGCELQNQSERSDRAAPNSVDPLGPLRGDWPADLPLRREAIITQVIGGRAGFIVTYKREPRQPL